MPELGGWVVRASTTRRPNRSRPGPGVQPSAASAPPPVPPSTFERFRELDSYRVNREWNRYEGTAQRDLLRTLRERFLRRHAISAGRALDLGCGPGRFLPMLVGGPARAVGLDVSAETLRQAGERLGGDRYPDRVRGDARRPPFTPGSFGLVAALGNLVGFAGPDGEALLGSAAALVAPEGRLLVEVAPGAGERSAYLHRLPVSALGRLFRAPTSAVLPRIRREEFREEPARKRRAGEFERWSVARTSEFLVRLGFEVVEEISIAPALGGSPTRVDAIRGDPKAWDHLVEVEELLGHDRARSPASAAVLVAAHRRPPDPRH